MKKKHTILCLKSLQYRQTFSDVKNADMMIQVDHVIRNRHRYYIIALRYDITSDIAPIILFKATGEQMIKQLKEIAKKNEILLCTSSYLSTMFDIIQPTYPSVIGKAIDEKCYPHFAKAFACILKFKQNNINQNLYDLSKAFDVYIDATIEKDFLYI